MTKPSGLANGCGLLWVFLTVIMLAALGAGIYKLAKPSSSNSENYEHDTE